MNPFRGVNLTVQVVRDSGPAGRAFGNVDQVAVADVAGEFETSIAASLLRGIADALCPPTVPVRTPELTFFGEPARTILAEFMDARCASCNHHVLCHNRTGCCATDNCGCERKPGDFR